MTELETKINDSTEEIPHGAERANEIIENAQLVPLNYLSPNPFALRKVSEDDNLEELSNSIRDVGILEPLIVVYRSRRQYIIIAGHRRFAAAKKAGLVNAPCILMDIPEDKFLQYALIENLQRTDLTPMEEAITLKKYIEETGLSRREIAAKIRKSLGFVNERVGLNDLPDDLKKALADGRLTMRKALDLAKIPVARIRERLMQKGVGMDTEQFKMMIEETLAQRGQGPKSKERGQWAIPELREFAQKRDNVKVFKDKISLRYDNPERLRLLLSELMDFLNTIGK